MGTMITCTSCAVPKASSDFIPCSPYSLVKKCKRCRRKDARDRKMNAFERYTIDDDPRELQSVVNFNEE